MRGKQSYLKGLLIVLGINTQGQQGISSMPRVQTEKALAWMSIFDDLRKRGVKNIFFLCFDNLPDKLVDGMIFVRVLII